MSSQKLSSDRMDTKSQISQSEDGKNQELASTLKKLQKYDITINADTSEPINYICLESFGIILEELKEGFNYGPGDAIGEPIISSGQDLIVPVRNRAGYAKAITPDKLIYFTFGDPNGMIGWLWQGERYYKPSNGKLLIRVGTVGGHPNSDERRPFKAYPTAYGWFMEVDSGRRGIYDKVFVYAQ